MSLFHQQTFSFICTTKHVDFTASYKFRSLKHFLSRGDFKPSAYRRPAKQYEIDSSMTNEVHDTNLIFLVFLNL